MELPPLIPIHSDNSLIDSKLNFFRQISTEKLLESLSPQQPGSLKTRLDGTMLDGHHRIKVLRERGLEVDLLAREVIPKTDLDFPTSN